MIIRELVVKAVKEADHELTIYELLQLVKIRFGPGQVQEQVWLLTAEQLLRVTAEGKITKGPRLI